LFWNPNYEYVKLCQIHYVAMRTKAFCKNANVPVILCGDFNSQPKSYVHRYLTTGSVNAKGVAPWYAHYHQRRMKDEESQNNEGDKNMQELSSDVTADLNKIHISEDPSNKSAEQNKVRYILDYTLNRFCRWMRILGLDAALETDEEEIQRTKYGNMILFQRCREEGRTLVTTSSRLLQRKDCPPGAYLLDTKSLSNLESTLVHLLLSHGIKLEPNKMLSRCVVCNGSIEPVFEEERKQQIFESHQAPDGLNDEILDVYQCDGCSQGYWWCEKPTSSASRVKTQATRLLEICISGGVEVDSDLGMFSFVDVEKIKNKSSEDSEEPSYMKQDLDVVRWLKTENLKNPLRGMTSAYAVESTGEESLPFTNVTSCFVGHLDYILYQREFMKVAGLLYVPKTFEELNDLDIANGHVLPSCFWPSDHLAVGSHLVWPDAGTSDDAIVHSSALPQSLPMESKTLWCMPTNTEPEPQREPISEEPQPVATAPSLLSPGQPENAKNHGQRCLCGCVPPIPSLFQMAELRKQARLKQAPIT